MAIAAEMDEVLSFISKGLAREYDMPENCLPYESAEGGWQLVEPRDSDDMFWDLDVCSEDSGSLRDDLANAFSDRQFVKRDPLVLSRADGLMYSWESFCEHTKHVTRFVFFRVKRRRRLKHQAWSPDDEWGGISSPSKILSGLGEIVKKHGLIKEFPLGMRVFRARQHAEDESVANARDLGSPPRCKASQSRMSPAGIPMFYGADNLRTAFVEVFNAKATTKNMITFGVFTSTRILRLLDLTCLPIVPSIFDRARYSSRPPLIFLRHFQEDVSKPIERDERVHYEYVPTQIVAEYFRHVYRERRKRIDGIVFRSSHKSAGACYCIFAASDACTDGPVDKAKHMLLLGRSISTWVDFAKGSFSVKPPIQSSSSGDGL